MNPNCTESECLCLPACQCALKELAGKTLTKKTESRCTAATGIGVVVARLAVTVTTLSTLADPVAVPMDVENKIIEMGKEMSKSGNAEGMLCWLL